MSNDIIIRNYTTRESIFSLHGLVISPNLRRFQEQHYTWSICVGTCSSFPCSRGLDSKGNSKGRVVTPKRVAERWSQLRQLKVQCICRQGNSLSLDLFQDFTLLEKIQIFCHHCCLKIHPDDVSSFQPCLLRKFSTLVEEAYPASSEVAPSSLVAHTDRMVGQRLLLRYVLHLPCPLQAARTLQAIHNPRVLAEIHP